MTPSFFSPLTPRWCGWCQQPLVGRSDKQFCSSACRNKAARHGAVGGAPIDWAARAAQAEQIVQALQAQLDQVAQARQALAPLERRYDEFTQVLQVLIPELQSSGLLTSLQQYVETLLADYAHHPGLAVGEASPLLRVQILQQLRATIERQLTYLQALSLGASGVPPPPASTR
jgi:hypothetical protein